MGFKDWLKSRKEKKVAKKEAKRDPYDILERKLQMELIKTDMGTERFETIRKELKDVNIMRGESRESKRRISKQDKGGLIIKIVSLIGGAAGLGTIIYAEHKGMTFTGEKRNIIGSISKAIGNVFGGFSR